MNRRVTLLTTVLLFLSSRAALAGDAPYSGGPHHVGDEVSVWTQRTGGMVWAQGRVIGDYAQIIAGDPHRNNGSDSHRFLYSVLYMGGKSIDYPGQFPLRVLTAEQQNGRDVLVGRTWTAEEYEKRLRDQLSHSAEEVLAATERGRELDAEARKKLEKLSKATDRSVARLTTAEGIRDLSIEMALEVGTEKFAHSINGKDEIENIMNETMLSYAKAKVTGSLPTSAPPFTADENGAVEATKTYVTESLRMKLGSLRADQREGLIARMLIDFGAHAMKAEKDELAEEAFMAVANVAAEYGLGPAAPLAKEALELGRQYHGYMETIEKAHQASVEFTRAANALNDARMSRALLADLGTSKRQVLSDLRARTLARHPDFSEFATDVFAQKLAQKYGKELAAGKTPAIDWRYEGLDVTEAFIKKIADAKFAEYSKGDAYPNRIAWDSSVWHDKEYSLRFELEDILDMDGYFPSIRPAALARAGAIARATQAVAMLGAVAPSSSGWNGTITTSTLPVAASRVDASQPNGRSMGGAGVRRK